MRDKVNRIVLDQIVPRRDITLLSVEVTLKAVSVDSYQLDRIVPSRSRFVPTRFVPKNRTCRIFSFQGGKVKQKLYPDFICASHPSKLLIRASHVGRQRDIFFQDSRRELGQSLKD